VTVSIFRAATSTEPIASVGELQATKGGPTVDAKSKPNFKVAILNIEGAHAKPGDRFRVGGNLTIRGRSVPVTLDATFNGVGKDPWGQQRAGFSASAEIDRRDWGLEWNQALETGGVLVGHTVKVQVDVEAVRQEATGKAVA